MIGTRTTIPRMQSDFYRDKYRKILRSLISLTVVIVCLIAVIMYLIFFSAEHQYYATTTEGQIIPMMPTAVTS